MYASRASERKLTKSLQPEPHKNWKFINEKGARLGEWFLEVKPCGQIHQFYGHVLGFPNPCRQCLHHLHTFSFLFVWSA
jgi:catechol-2,3-dioxygenase